MSERARDGDGSRRIAVLGGWFTLRGNLLEHDPLRINQSQVARTVLACRWWPVAVLGVGFLARLYRLGHQSVWYDEGVSLYLASQSPGQLIRHTAGDIHPPLYYLLLSFWTGLAGRSEFAAAFLSVCFGTLIIAVALHVGSRLYDRTVGLVTALLLAVSSYQLWYSQEIRMYTLGAFVGLTAFWGAWNLLGEPVQDKRNRNRYGILYVIAGALGLYTLYYFAFLLITFNIWALVRFVRRWPKRESIRSDAQFWIMAQLAILILYIPWLGTALHQIQAPPVPPWRSAVSLWTIIVQSWSALSFGQSVIPGEVILALLLAAAIYAVGTWVSFRRNTDLGISLLLYTAFPLTLIAVASLCTPLFHVRYVFTYSPGFYLMLAAGFVYLVRRVPMVGVLAAVVWLVVTGYSTLAYHYDPRCSSDDFRGAVQHIADSIRPGDAILINAGYAYPPFLYYYPGEIAWRGRLVHYDTSLDLAGEAVALQTGSIDGSPTLGWGRADSDFYATDKTQTEHALKQVFSSHPRLWVLRAYDTVVDPEGFVRTWLSDEGFMFEDRSFAGESYIRVQGFLTQKEPAIDIPPLAGELDVIFGDGLRLIGYGDGRDVIESGQPWDGDLYWSAARRLPSDFRVLVELADEGGRPWARWDEMPLGNAYPTSRWQKGDVLRQPVRLVVPYGVPPGDYEVRLMVYDPKTQEALTVTDAQGRSSAEPITLSAVTVSD